MPDFRLLPWCTGCYTLQVSSWLETSGTAYQSHLEAFSSPRRTNAWPLKMANGCPIISVTHYQPMLCNTLNPFMSLFTTWRTNFSTTVLLTLTLLFAKQGTTLYLISTSSIENIYTNGLNIFCYNLSPSTCSVFSIVIIFHCCNIDVSDIHSHELNA
jgi:hypothetical protein